MYIFWTLLGIFFLYFDYKKSSAIKLTFASTFMFCAIIAFKFPDNFNLQFFSMFFLFFVFRLLITAVYLQEKKDIAKQNKLEDFVGKKALVVKDIGKTLSIDGIGYVKYDNTLWQAKNINDKLIKAGKRVRIISRENKILNVEVIK